jgi:hypothetical protein
VAPVRPITFKVIPEKAVLIVDGATLPSSARSMPRPAAGTTHRVTVHADGYDDQTLTIDDTAPASVDVWLNETAGSGGAEKKSGGAPRGNGEGAKAPEALPANPY